MPVDAVNFIQRQQLRVAIFSPDYWGGYLIYRLSPRDKVVVDDRHDFYGENFLAAYLTTMHVEPGWESFIHWRNCLLLPRRSALAAVLLNTPEWKIAYSDDLAVIFVPTREHKDTDRVPSR